MTRDTVTSVTSAAAAPQLRYRVLVDLLLDSGTQRVCSGNQPILVGTIGYTPVGGFGGIETVQEESDVFPRAVRLWVTAVSSVNLAEAMSEDMFNRTVRVYRSFLNDQYTLVGTPQLVFSGKINDGTLKMGDPERGNYIELEVESRLRREPRSAYFTKESHQLTNSGDTFFAHVHKIPNYKGVWGDEASVRLGSNSGGDPTRGPGNYGGLPRTGNQPR